MSANPCDLYDAFGSGSYVDGDWGCASGARRDNGGPVGPGKDSWVEPRASCAKIRRPNHKKCECEGRF